MQESEKEMKKEGKRRRKKERREEKKEGKERKERKGEGWKSGQGLAAIGDVSGWRPEVAGGGG